MPVLQLEGRTNNVTPRSHACSHCDIDAGSVGPLVGVLQEMCSSVEREDRQRTRQLHVLEQRRGTDPRCPHADPALATKKYQRSAAGKKYCSEEVRTLEACWKTMMFLIDEVLDLDECPKPFFAAQSSLPFYEIYAYLHDRTRAVRVDLLLQQPRSLLARAFIETHECCLRLEILSLFLLARTDVSTNSDTCTQQACWLAISQCVEPLLHSYRRVGDMRGCGAFSSPALPAVLRYIVLLHASCAPCELSSLLAGLRREVLAHPLVAFARHASVAYAMGDYGRFLQLYRRADFLTAAAMMAGGVVDLARLRMLWMLVRASPQSIGDSLPITRIMSVLAFNCEEHARDFLTFHGVRVMESGVSGVFAVLPKRGSPEAVQHPLLVGPPVLPEACGYSRKADPLLVSKYISLECRRADVVFGRADPSDNCGGGSVKNGQTL